MPGPGGGTCFSWKMQEGLSEKMTLAQRFEDRAKALGRNESPVWLEYRVRRAW